MEKHAEIRNTKQLADQYRDSQKWISQLHFTGDEMSFIEKLLNSDVFEPSTPNLFERLQDFLKRLENSTIRFNKLYEAICAHERELGGLMECAAGEADHTMVARHIDMAREIEEYQGKFNMLKSEIFNYTGGILKRRKK